jgi:ribA/ribD-fused uncharacterized protein
MAEGARPDFVFFWKHTPPEPGVLGAECFSQWYPSPFVVDGEGYRTAEHLMMSEKARLFGDEAVVRAIQGAATPMEAKRLGRAVQGFDERTWVSHRSRIVLRACVAKFSQDAALRAYLLGTGDAILAEASPTDTVWGIGLAAEDPNARDPSAWRGLGLLGFALMEARWRLRDGSA